MKYNIKFDYYDQQNCILDQLHIKDFKTIPETFSWYTSRPKVCASLSNARIMTRLLLMSRFGKNLDNMKIIPDYLNE